MKNIICILSLIIMQMISFADENKQVFPSAKGATAFVIGPSVSHYFNPNDKKWIRIDNEKSVKAIVERISTAKLIPSELASLRPCQQLVALDHNGKIIQAWVLNLSAPGMVINRCVLKIKGNTCRVSSPPDDPFLLYGVDIPELHHLKKAVTDKK